MSWEYPEAELPQHGHTGTPVSPQESVPATLPLHVPAGEGQKRSRWERWGLSRMKKEKMASQPSIPSSLLREDGSAAGRQHAPSESGRHGQDMGHTGCPLTPCPHHALCSPDFPPIFHIKLKDQVLLEGDALTLCCLPAGCPTPRIVWMKGGGC